ncbi:MAG: hypothetical protein CMG41_05245 [Candidatus Marinimicrobia bacterium]|nr:hypothetical protein [Candidatus Neomarinimicrobiota bacterium]|tara:strand:- start:1598 stop:2062 length:465 start_codon:yes stop_codon:yes gene_type:complete
MLIKKIFYVYLFFAQFLFSQTKHLNEHKNIIFDTIKEIKLFHSPPEPLFIGRPFELSLVTEINESLLSSVLLFFKTNKMETYREITLHGESGLYNYKIDIKKFPGESIDYFFAVKTLNGRIYGAPVDENKIISPIKKIFIDPVEYFEQKKRLNQ